MLGCPVYALSANNKNQVQRLKERLHKAVVQGVALNELKIRYDVEFEQAIDQIQPVFANHSEVSARALSIRALEQDLLVLNNLSSEERDNIAKVQNNIDLDIDLTVADTKYTFLHEQCKKCAGLKASLVIALRKRWITSFSISGLVFHFSLSLCT